MNTPENETQALIKLSTELSNINKTLQDSPLPNTVFHTIGSLQKSLNGLQNVNTQLEKTTLEHNRSMKVLTALIAFVAAIQIAVELGIVDYIAAFLIYLGAV